MAIHTVPGNETQPLVVTKPPPVVSTVSVKYQHRQNFPFSGLKWQMNQSNAQCFLLRFSSTPIPENGSAYPLKNDYYRSSSKHGDSSQSPLLRSGPSSMAENEHRDIKVSCSILFSSRSVNSKLDDRDHRVKDEVKSGISREKSADAAPIEGLEKKLASPTRIVDKKEWIVSNSDGKSNIFIQFPARNKAAAVDDTECAVQVDEPMAKMWNLRPRHSATKPPNGSGGGPENKPRSRSPPQWAAPEGNVAEERQVFSISLSKEEIEQDFLGMTGFKPPRKPKRRARTVQKQLDETFPGLLLTNVTADLYEG